MSKNDKLLTIAEARRIHDRGERIFATKCLKKPNLEVTHQIQVGRSVIDFKVENLSIPPHLRGSGKLVEVKKTPAAKLKQRLKLYGSKRRQKANTKRQLGNMRSSGQRHTILSVEKLLENQKHTKKKCSEK